MLNDQDIPDNELPEGFTFTGWRDGMQHAEWNGYEYVYLSADGVRPARWSITRKVSR